MQLANTSGLALGNSTGEGGTLVEFGAASAALEVAASKGTLVVLACARSLCALVAEDVVLHAAHHALDFCASSRRLGPLLCSATDLARQCAPPLETLMPELRGDYGQQYFVYGQQHFDNHQVPLPTTPPSLQAPVGQQMPASWRATH